MALTLLIGCTSVGSKKTSQNGVFADGRLPPGHITLPAANSAEGRGGPVTGPVTGEQVQAMDRTPRLFPGTGRFVGIAKRPANGDTGDTGKITLNFERTDLREVVKVILGDTLQQGYVLDPKVQGSVTLQTGKPLSMDDLLPTLEMLLRMNGAAMVPTDGIYHIIPVSNALRGNLTPQLGETTRPLPYGYSVRVIPLQYISADEMAKILTPLASEGSIIRVDSLRNLLILAGTGAEMSSLLDAIHMFDVDWIKGLSVGFFTLKYASPEEMIKRLNTLFGDDAGGGLSGLLRMVPIEDANGLLIVSPRKGYLNTVRVWIERLDKVSAGAGDGNGEQQLYVYRVHNGDATKLAGLLSQLFAAQEPGVRLPQVAPGLTPVSLTSPPAKGEKAGTPPQPPATPTRVNLQQAETARAVRIVADGDRNALLITASPRQYGKIISALEQLDVVPLQVLVEATIVEVSLTDDLKYGLQWFFKTHHGSSRTGTFSLDNDAGSGLSGLIPGFNFSLISSAGDVRAVFSALADDSLVQVLSSPSVMVLNNHSARIQVGDQVPIATRQQSDNDPLNNVINNIEYRDTGVVLEVTPRVNPGGLVIMDISQEVSDVVTTETSNLNSPTIRTRKISSSIAVQSGEAIVLGGLIKDKDAHIQGGTPILQHLPVIGWLFGQTIKNSERTELVIVLIPKVISDAKDARGVVEEFRNKLEGLKGAF